MGASLDKLGTRFSLVCLADEDALLAEPDQRSGKLLPTRLYGVLNHHIGEHDPVLVVLDTLADLFGGDEIKRAHVRQFVSMLRRLAFDHDCAVLLLAHPSLDGMRSGSGTSGSTAWNNSVRSRLYLTAPNNDDPDARELSQKKSNYGPRDTTLRLRWRDGVFVEDDGKPSPAEGLLSSRADAVFAAALSKLTRQGQRLSPSKSPTYAPRVIARQGEAKGITVKQLEEAQQRLLDNGQISILEEGPPSRRYRRLVVSAEDFSGKEVV
jgi:RecA-family ATPase